MIGQLWRTHWLRVKGALTTFSEVASPILNRSSELHDGAQQMRLSLLQALAQGAQADFEAYDKQLDALKAGRDPIGVSFDATAKPVEFEAGNFIREA